MSEKIIGEGVTFDDVLLVPRHSTVLPTDVDTSTRLTRKIELHIPIVSTSRRSSAWNSLTVLASLRRSDWITATSWLAMAELNSCRRTSSQS